MKLSNVAKNVAKLFGSGIAVYLWGAPGIGKTAIANQMVGLIQDAINETIQMITIRVNLMESVDFGGLPMPTDDGRVKWLIPDFVPKEGTKGILFLDEFAQAPQAVQCAAMRLIDHLPSGWQVLLASNRASDRAGVGQVPTHVLGRCTHINVDVDRGDWQAWALNAGIHPFVRGFIDFQPQKLFEFDAAVVQRERANCSPRSWEKVSKLLYLGIDDFEVLEGTIGKTAATEFLAFVANQSGLVKVSDVLADPMNAEVPIEPAMSYAICTGLAEHQRQEGKTPNEAILKYLGRLKMEFGALLMIDMVAVCPATITHPIASKWIGEHSALFVQGRA